MKILVTGGAGFIGSSLIKRLNTPQNNIVSLDNYSTGYIKNHHKGVTYINGNTWEILDIEELKTGPVVLAAANDTTLTLTFTVQYDRDAFVLGAVQNFLIEEGRTTGGVAKNSDHETLGSATTTSTTALAIEELVVRGITKGYQDYVTNVRTAVGAGDIFTRSYRVYDGAQGSESQEVLTVKAPITPKAAHTDVTVTNIDGTTLPTT